MKLAVNLAVITYNGGMGSLTSVIGRLGLQPGPLCLKFLGARDAFRIERADARQSEVVKKMRKAEHRRKAALEERRCEKEGVTYESGAF